ncbi:MAG TPA: hypothetical protein VGL42_11935 [Opitutaceae bacterium]|jgi:hypothetical protein
MKLVFAFLALMGAGLVLAPPVARSVRTRVQHATDAAQQSVSSVAGEVDRLGSRLIEAVEETGSELIDRLPPETPPVWSPPAVPPVSEPIYPRPAYIPWPGPMTIFRHETFRRRWERIGRP